ncbi:MAG: recombinase family protein [Acidimicrobiaceae bacterium]|nr:recombinase family protein [Acidimicrobiaceae bacterium]
MSKITLEHLRRSAYIYIRQSTLDQLQHNPESRRRQYALQSRAQALGWQDIVVLDEDLGRSGSGVERPGFDRLLSAICRGEVGAVLSIEASRLARNGRDWHTLLEYASLVNTLLVDEDGIYDPRHPNDRLLLGMKGTLSEMELSTFRQRSQEALKLKAERGELYTTVAVGYVRTDDERLEKDPNRRVQESISLVFGKFQEFGSVRQVLLWLRQERIELPAVVYSADGRRIVWKLPVYNSVHKTLTNPIYAGAYAHGRTESRTRIEAGRKQITRGCRKAQADWNVLISDHHTGYITWDEYQANQAMIAENANRKGAMVRGSVRRGEALLPGLLRCGHCGRKLTVTYSGPQGNAGRYQCRGATINHGVAENCISFGGLRVEQAVVGEVLEVLRPLGIEAAFGARAHREQQLAAIYRQRELALEQARFEADRARRQYDAIDPENRLVAAELELRWDEALQVVAQGKGELEALNRSETLEITEEQRQSLFALAHDLPAVWEHPATPPETKKRILRTVLNEIVVFVRDHRIGLVLHWQGGDHTELEVIKNRSGHHRWKTDIEIARVIQALARLMPDARMAGLLNQLGKRTAKGHRWTRNRVCSFRNDHQIPVYEEGERQSRNELTLEESAKRLGVSTMTVRRLIKQEVLPGTQVCVGAPWVIQVSDLSLATVRSALRDSPPTANDKQGMLHFQ